MHVAILISRYGMGLLLVLEILQCLYVRMWCGACFAGSVGYESYNHTMMPGMALLELLQNLTKTFSLLYLTIVFHGIHLLLV